MLTINELEIAGPGADAHPGYGSSSFRRILVPVRSPGESAPALAAAAQICGMTGGVLRLVHVRTCDPLLRSAARFYRETAAEAAAVLEEALLAAWACGGPRATMAVVDAQRGDVALAIAWQAAAWPADLIVLARRPRPAITRLVWGSVPDQVMRKASCPVLTIPASHHDREHHRPDPQLADGYCARPAQQDCPHPNACLTCPDFQTTPVFLPIHRRQAATNRRLIAQADATGQARLAENLRRVQASLDAIIPALETLGNESSGNEPR